MNNHQEQQLEDLRKERFKKLCEFEELEDTIRKKEKQALNDLDNLQQTAYHYLTTYHDNETEIHATLSQIDKIKNDLQSKFKNSRHQIERQRADYEYDYQIKKRKLNED